MRYLKFIFYVIVGLFLIVIIIENLQPLAETVHFKFDLFSLHYRTVEIPLYYIVAISFLLGVTITVFYFMFEWFRHKRQKKDLYKIIRDKDKELNSLKNLTITSGDTGPGNVDDIVK